MMMMMMAGRHDGKEIGKGNGVLPPHLIHLAVAVAKVTNVTKSVNYTLNSDNAP